MNSTYASYKARMLALAREGKLGTPDAPDRSNSLHQNFWHGYFGRWKPTDFPPKSSSKACVAAGRQFRKEQS